MNGLLSKNKVRPKIWYWVIPIIFFIAFLFLRFSEPALPIETIVLKGETLEVAIPHTIAHMRKGLGERDSIAPYDGMLFVFDAKNRHGIVMRKMRFSIDIVWFDGAAVVDIAPAVPPEDVPEHLLTVYRPRAEATMVLELPAGWAAAHGLGIGDQLVVEGRVTGNE